VNVLALDMATKTGWALWRDGVLSSGVEDLSRRRNEHPQMRLLRLKALVERLLGTLRPDQPLIVYYEEPIQHQRNKSGFGLGCNFEGVLLTALPETAIYTRVHPSALKKHATGKGNAGKGAMVQAARDRWGVEPADDNEGDALCLLAYALDELGITACHEEESE